MSKKKVLLLHAPIGNYSYGDKWEENKSLSPPLGLLYLGAALNNGGYNPFFLDLNVDCISKTIFLKYIKGFNIILITCYNETISNIKQIIKDIKIVNKNAVILCGGPYCNTVQEYVEGSDLTCLGEAEGYINDILAALISKKSLNSIPGLIYKQNGQLIRNPGIMITEDLDLSHPPCRELIRRDRYGFIGNIRLNIVVIMSSRGCPFKCRYCAFVIANEGYRERSIKNVIKEIKDLVNQGYKYFLFGDENFLLHKKRVHRLMDSIIKEKLDIRMIIQGRVDSADFQLFIKLREAGVIMIFMGLESANQDVLDYYNKRTTIERGLKAITLANKVGIITGGFFIIGASIETLEHFKRNKRYFDRVPLDLMECFILSYSTGSSLWRDAVQEGILQKNDHHVLASNKTSNFSTQELIEIRKDLIRHFYFKPKRILRFYRKLIRLGEFDLLIRSPLLLKNSFSNILRSKKW